MSNQHAKSPEHAPEIHSVGNLTLSNFRNHTYTSLDLAGKSVVLYGPNGAGKTNILEAISLLAPGRGFRRSKLSEMDRQGANEPWIISAEIFGAIGEVQVGTTREITHPVHGLSYLTHPARGEGKVGVLSTNDGVDSSPPFDYPPQAVGIREGERRVVRVNGQPLKNANQLSEYLSMLWLTPQMDSLFFDGGTARRKFLDRLVYGFEPAHATRVNRYETAMRERNKLLAESRAPGDWLTSIEVQMATQGTAIAFARQQAIEHINQVMHISTLDFPKADLSIHGAVEHAIQEGAAALDVEKLYLQLLANSRAADAQSGRTLVGVHRAEFRVTHLHKHMEAAYCSTGEQKALLLAILLAEARASSLWHGHVPLLILDEVAAHLDPKKRHELYKEIQELKAQVWMSGVSCDLFEEMHDNSVFFRVEQGKIFRD